MIFEKVTNITKKDEFLEKILIYIRLVEVIAEREGIVIPKKKVLQMLPCQRLRIWASLVQMKILSN